MLRLLILPIELLRIAFYAVRGLVDALSARNRLRFEFTVLIDAPREAVWRFITADKTILDGSPTMELWREPVPDSDDLYLTHVVVGGQPFGRSVERELERDEAKGITLHRSVPHPLSVPPDGGRDYVGGSKIEATSRGTALMMFHEFTIRSFRDRIVMPIGLRRLTNRFKQQCEQEAGTHSRLTALANHGLILSAVAVLSFWYLWGWQLALLLSMAVVAHEAGHAAAMQMVGVGVRGIYLIPFFGGAAVPKTAYRSEGRLGFIALMGPGMSLIPTLGLAAMFAATGGVHYLQAALIFAVMNAINLLPIYPLDGGLILNALLGSVSRKSAQIAGWIGVLIGLGVAVYLHSFLIGVPFLLFALQRYLTGSRTIELERLTLTGGTALALASVATLAVYAFVLYYAVTAPGRGRLFAFNGYTATVGFRPASGGKADVPNL